MNCVFSHFQVRRFDCDLIRFAISFSDSVFSFLFCAVTRSCDIEDAKYLNSVWERTVKKQLLDEAERRSQATGGEVAVSEGQVILRATLLYYGLPHENNSEPVSASASPLPLPDSPDDADSEFCSAE